MSPLASFLLAVADALPDFEPEYLHPYTSEAYAAAEAQQHAEEVAS